MARNSDPTVAECVSHILESIKVLKDVSFEVKESDFYQDVEKMLASQKLIENIGEAFRYWCKNDPLAKETYEYLPIGDWIAAKNVLNHGYHRVSFKILWDTIQIDIPHLEGAMSQLPAEITEGLVPASYLNTERLILGLIPKI